MFHIERHIGIQVRQTDARTTFRFTLMLSFKTDRQTTFYFTYVEIQERQAERQTAFYFIPHF